MAETSRPSPDPIHPRSTPPWLSRPLRRIIAISLLILVPWWAYFHWLSHQDLGDLSGAAGDYIEFFRLMQSSMGGFDPSHLLIPKDEIQFMKSRDEIRAITNPRFLKAEAAEYLKPDDLVIGLTYGDDSRAYPLRVLRWRQCVNDNISGLPIAVTYGPLTEAVVTFIRQDADREWEFGVSGLLHQNDVLFFDRRTSDTPTESLWSQVGMRAVSGPASGQELQTIPCVLSTWSVWLAENPQTVVLGEDPDRKQIFATNPYEEYEATPNPFTPVKFDERFPAKTRVMCLEHKGEKIAWVVDSFRDLKGLWKDNVGDITITLRYDPDMKTLRLVAAEPDQPRQVYAFWFAWSALHPDTKVIP
ncbi:MAG: DUF3179 domain-containing (seleno)protein [bacterium]